MAAIIGRLAAKGEKVNVITAMKWLADSVVNFAKAIRDCFLSLPQIWMSMWAIFMIVVVALIGMGIMYLIYVLNPRLPGMNHIVDIDAYVSSTYSPALVQAIVTVASYSDADAASWISGFNDFQGMMIDAKALMSLGVEDASGGSASGTSASGTSGSLKGDLAVYLSFRSSIMNNNNMVTAADIRSNAPQFVKPDGTTIDTSGFENTVLNPLNDLWSRAGSVSGQLHDLGDLRTYLTKRGVADEDAQKRAVLFAAAVHQIRMLMDQVPAIEGIYMAGRPSKNAVWTLYYLPFMVNVFTVRIPSTWEHWPDDFELLFETYITWWNDLGNFVTSIPMYIARNVSVDHFEPFLPTGDSLRQNMESNKKEIREGFGLGDIFSLAGAIANLMGDIGMIVTTFANIISNFISDPFGEFIALLLMLLGIVITIPLTILYFLTKVLMIDIILATVYAFILSVAWCVIYTLFLVLTVVLVAVPYFFLWILDIMTGGMISRLMRCENNPHGWYADPGFVEGNEYSAEPLSCWGPCSQRYKLTYGGSCCGARSGYMPDFCPQQQIYRIYASGAPVKDRGPSVMVNYTPQVGFNTMTIEQRKAAIEAAYMEKIVWYQNCYDGLGSRDYLTRHLCDSVDVLFPFDAAATASNQTSSSPPPPVNVAMSTACKEIFCDYQPGTAGQHAWRTANGFQPGSAGSQESCERLAKAAALNVAGPTSPPGTDLLKQVLLVSMVVVGIMVSVRSITSAS